MFFFDNGNTVQYSTTVYHVTTKEASRNAHLFLSAVERTSMALMGFNFKPNPTLPNRMSFYFSLFSGP